MSFPSIRRFSRLAAIVLFACALPVAASADAPRPVRVQVVKMTSPHISVTYSGTVQARVLANIAFRVQGKVIERPVSIGDAVKAGQIIAKLDPNDLVLALEADAQAVTAAQAAATNAKSDLDRYEKLGRNSAAFLPSEYDKRAAASAMAEARLAQARRQLALSHDKLTYSTLQADADALITALPVQVGQVVSAGQTVASLAYAAETEVVVDVPENRLTDVKGASEVSVTLWSNPGKVLRGRLREIGAVADAASRTFAVKITLLDRPDTLALGMTASVQFVHPIARPVALLPASALADDKGKPAVWVLDPKSEHAALRPVTVAAFHGDDAVAIASGLTSGEEVITAGLRELDPEMKLVPWDGPTR